MTSGPVVGLVYCVGRNPARDFARVETDLKQLVASGSIKISVGTRESPESTPGLVGGFVEPVIELAGWFFKGWEFTKEIPGAVEQLQQALVSVSETVGEYQQVIVFMALNSPTFLQVKHIVDELRLFVKELPARRGLEVSNVDPEFYMSPGGKLRAERRARMQELVDQKKQAWSEGNRQASQRLSAEMRDLLENEVRVRSGVVGGVIRT